MDLHPSVAEFFHDAVTESLASLKVEATESTEFYLVNLLVEFTKTTPVDPSPVTLKMAQISTARPDEKVKGLKEIGDTTLYMSGFFADNLARRLVDVDYYMSVGGAAYNQLAGLVVGSRGSTQIFHEVYGELSAKFARFVEVFQEIRRHTNFVGTTNIVRLYEEWVRTGSEWLERRLRDSGMFAVESFDKKIVH